MSIFFGIFGLLVLGIGAVLFLALLRWLVLVGIVVLFSVGVVALAIAGIAGFWLYQFFGEAYGSLVIAASIVTGLASAVLILRRIATEIGIRSTSFKENQHAR